MNAPITYSRESDWSESMPTTAVSHRSTTSSRLPGKAIEGSVTYVVSRIVPCTTCGGFRREGIGLHAWWWSTDAAGRHIRVDCAGQPLTGEPTP